MEKQIDRNKLPKHVAIIMDGNGRWAKRYGLFRVFGHKTGSETVKKVIESSANLGIKYLTLYTFSTENWNRPKAEIDTLMDIIVKTLKNERDTIMQNNVKMNAIGRIEDLPKSVQEELSYITELSKDNTGLVLTLALSYGSREEITFAVKEICKAVKNNTISINNIDELIINNHLYTPDMPDVDLLIRTSGEQRISNFMLWQIAYAELYFTDVMWPDFGEKDLYKAIISYQKRERRFGKISEQI